MKLIAEPDAVKHEIEVERGDGLTLNAIVDGRNYQLEASEPEENVYLFKHENRIYQIFVAPNKNFTEPFEVSLSNQSYEIKLYDPKQLRGKNSDGGAIEGISEIKTAMPGKIVRILVESGAQVNKGDGVIIVEAMKMQNELKSPKDGVVKEIRFSEGATVNAGEVLIVVE